MLRLLRQGITYSQRPLHWGVIPLLLLPPPHTHLHIYCIHTTSKQTYTHMYKCINPGRYFKTLPSLHKTYTQINASIHTTHTPAHKHTPHHLLAPHLPRNCEVHELPYNHIPCNQPITHEAIQQPDTHSRGKTERNPLIFIISFTEKTANHKHTRQ